MEAFSHLQNIFEFKALLLFTVLQIMELVPLLENTSEHPA